MNASVRHVAFAAALLSSLAGAAFVGCAESPSFPDDDITDDDGTSKPNKKDAAVPDDSDDGDDDPIVEVDADVDEEDADVDDEDGSAGLDGGKDAGSKDAGSKDAGYDAGTKDAGTKDAGTKDAGTIVDAGGDDDEDSGVLKPSQGEIVISEVMFNPSATNEASTEWFEVYNTTTEERRLSGLTIKDKSRTHVIAAGVRIQPGEYVVLVRNRTDAEGVGIASSAIAYDYGFGVSDSKVIVLANDKDAVVSLFDGDNEIARANYGSFGMNKNGMSIQLKTLDYASAGDKVNWCVSANAWAGADKGTPGAASDCN